MLGRNCGGRWELGEEGEGSLGGGRREEEAHQRFKHRANSLGRLLPEEETDFERNFKDAESNQTTSNVRPGNQMRNSEKKLRIKLGINCIKSSSQLIF